jgi:hypothetical protein
LKGNYKLKKTHIKVVLVVATAALGVHSTALWAFSAEETMPPADWLINPVPFQAQIRFDAGKHELTLENGLTRRTLRLAPNVATNDYSSLVTGEVTLDAGDDTLFNAWGPGLAVVTWLPETPEPKDPIRQLVWNAFLKWPRVEILSQRRGGYRSSRTARLIYCNEI